VNGSAVSIRLYNRRPLPGIAENDNGRTGNTGETLNAFYSDTFVLPLPPGHRFPMVKYRRLRDRILEERVLSPEELHVPEAIPWHDLLLVHDAEYVDAVARGTLAVEVQRRIGFPWSPEMVERARRSVGGTLAAARSALAGTNRVTPVSPDPYRSGAFIAANLAGGTHHAFRDRGEGYCVFNDVAVATSVLLRDGAILRAAVIDCDVHQGNGTAAIFRGDPRVFTCSLHAAGNFPFHKETSDLDIAFPDATGDDEYLAALATNLSRILDERRPEIVFYLAGADPYAGDRLGRLELTIDGLRRRDRRVFEMCRERDVAVAVAMSGGYAPDIDAIVEIHLNTLREAVHACRSVSAC
jgi:acetoin utilization deacetylase AcuC-like enzyme